MTTWVSEGAAKETHNNRNTMREHKRRIHTFVPDRESFLWEGQWPEDSKNSQRLTKQVLSLWSSEDYFSNMIKLQISNMWLFWG